MMSCKLGSRALFALAVAVGACFTSCASGAVSKSVKLYEAGDYKGAAQVAGARRAAAPSDDDAWRMHVRALLALGDRAALIDAYAAYQKERTGDDGALVRELAEATLGQGLRSPSVALRVASIRAVEKNEVRGLADAVAERMTDPDDRVVAAAAAAVLRGYADATTALDDMLRSEDDEARRLALDGLGRKVAPHAVDVLAAGAEDPSAAVRETAVRHLGGLRDPKVAPALIARCRDRDASVRATALRALAGFGKGHVPTAARPAAVAALRDSALGVRLAAIELTAIVGEAGALEPLLSDGEPSVALAAARALAVDPAVAAPIVERGLGAAAWSDRVATLNQLGALLGGGAVARARGLVADPVVEVRLAAARVLSHGGATAEALPVLLAAAAPLLGEAGARAAPASAVDAAADLVELGDPAGALALSTAMRAPDPAIRARAVSAHRLVGRITAALLGGLADASGAVRIDTAAVLAELARNLE